MSREYRVVFANGVVTGLRTRAEAVRWAAMYEATTTRIEYRNSEWLPIFPARSPSRTERGQDE